MVTHERQMAARIPACSVASKCASTCSGWDAGSLKHVSPLLIISRFASRAL